jgi:ribosomal protein S19
VDIGKKSVVVYGVCRDKFFCPKKPLRDQTILTPYFDRRLLIPTGKKGLSRRVDASFQGYKFGEFAPTRRSIPKPTSRPKLNKSGKKKTGKK